MTEKRVRTKWGIEKNNSAKPWDIEKNNPAKPWGIEKHNPAKLIDPNKKGGKDAKSR